MFQPIETLQSLVRFYADHEVEELYIKCLSPNDNSKNQVYFGPGFAALTLFPLGPIAVDPDGANAIFKAPVTFQWIGDDLSLVPAPAAQVILYPQYPEVRFSGFLKGASSGPISSIRSLMNSRTLGRMLFMGVTRAGGIIGAVFGPDHPVSIGATQTLNELSRPTELFYGLQTSVFLGAGGDPRSQLLAELCRVHRLGWIDSKRLDGAGHVMPCNAPQCGGYTLEAELGITPNGYSEPDFLGWEVKQHSARVLTLMTPEPTGGFYREHGVERFVRAFGYPDRNGVPDRLNFGGVHLCDVRHALTGLTLRLQGFDSARRLITDRYGGIELVSDAGVVAAQWPFTGLLQHWNRKHRNAVYVPSERRTEAGVQYRYSDVVKLGLGTDPLLLLGAIKAGRVYYDPGIKLENASTARPAVKRRSQFRVNLRHLDSLYTEVADEHVMEYCS